MARVPRYLFGRARAAAAEAIESGTPSGGGGSGAIVKRSLAEQTFHAPFVDASAFPGAVIFPSAARVPGLTIPFSVTEDFAIVEALLHIEYGQHPATLELGVVVDGKTWTDYGESTYNWSEPARATGGWSTLVNINNSQGSTRAAVMTDTGNDLIGFGVLGPAQDPWLTLIVGPGDHELDLGIRTPVGGAGQDVQIRNAVLAARVVG